MSKPKDDAGESKTYEETVALTSDELGIITDSEEKNHEETVALTREELGLSREESHEETVALTREELGLPPDAREESHEETVALTREELGLPPEDREESHEETVALTREELGLPPETDEMSYEETVALSMKELGMISDTPEESHEETVALTREELGLSPEENYQETVALSMKELGEESSKPVSYEETVALSSLEERGRQEAPKEPKPFIASLEATGMEIDQFNHSVAKEHGDDKYLFLGRLVSGGMGAILKVVDRDLNRLSAMKVVLPSFKEKKDTLSSFITEAKITGLLEHPNIVPVHELGLLEKTGIYFTMKMAKGEALNDVLNKLHESDLEYIQKYNTYHLLSIFRKICDATSYAHSRQIIHQDIKPHNVMVGDYGEVLLMDWGLAAVIGDPEDSKDHILEGVLKDIVKASAGKENLIKGSPVYMSPEQVKGDPSLLDQRSDIFLLGGTLYHMFTLEPPYFGSSIKDILKKAMKRDLIPPDERNPARQIPEEICRIILKAMAPAKEDRYQSVDEMAGDIDDLISGKWTRQDKKEFQKGDMLMEEGAVGEEAYLILGGKVQVVKEAEGQKIVLGKLQEGDIVGEMSLISTEARSASVEALKETEVAILTKHVVSQNLKKLPPYMEKIVSTLTDRLRMANTLIHPHATHDCTYVVLKQLRLTFMDKSGNHIEDFNIPLKELVTEISGDLGLPEHKIKDVIDKAAQTDILKIKSGLVFIPDVEELIQFTNFAKSMANLPSEG